MARGYDRNVPMSFSLDCSVVLVSGTTSKSVYRGLTNVLTSVRFRADSSRRIALCHSHGSRRRRSGRSSSATRRNGSRMITTRAVVLPIFPALLHRAAAARVAVPSQVHPDRQTARNSFASNPPTITNPGPASASAVDFEGLTIHRPGGHNPLRDGRIALIGHPIGPSFPLPTASPSRPPPCIGTYPECHFGSLCRCEKTGFWPPIGSCGCVSPDLWRGIHTRGKRSSQKGTTAESAALRTCTRRYQLALFVRSALASFSSASAISS